MQYSMMRGRELITTIKAPSTTVALLLLDEERSQPRGTAASRGIVAAKVSSQFHVGSVGQGFAFPVERLRHFITSNGFGPRLAAALHGLADGEAIAIKAARQRIVVSRSTNGVATLRRRFRLARDIL